MNFRDFRFYSDPMKLFSLGFILILALARTASAYNPEAGKVTVTLGPFLYKTDYSNPYSDVRSPWTGDIGLIANGDVNDTGSLEVTLFHMNKVYFRDQSGMIIAEEAQLVHLAMGYRYWLSHYFSTALDLYSDYTLGDSKIVHSDFPDGMAPQTSAHNINSYGLELSLQGDLWSNDLYSVVLDGRYGHSITSKSHEHADQYMFLIGLKYLVQQRDKPKPALTK